MILFDLHSITRDRSSSLSIFQMTKPNLGAALKKEGDAPEGQSWLLASGVPNPDTVPLELDPQTT